MRTVLNTHALRGRFQIFNIKVCFQSSRSIPSEETLQSVQTELQHLATLLMEHVAGGAIACLCDITIYLLFWILFELGWKDQEKVHAGRHIWSFFFSSLLPHSNLRHAKRLDIVFYTFILVPAFWEWTCFEREWERVYTISPRISMQRAENINRTTDALHITFVDMMKSCQMHLRWIDNFPLNIFLYFSGFVCV